MDKIYEAFISWIAGIEEEEPLPRETKNVFFALTNRKDINELIYSANERFNKFIDNFEYFPLEGQLFYHNEFLNSKKYSDIESIYCLVKRALKNKSFKKIIGDRIIYIGYIYHKPDYVLDIANLL